MFREKLRANFQLFIKQLLMQESRKEIANVLWLFGDRALRLSVSVITTIIVARYLGPSQFGLLSFVLAIYSMLVVIPGFGLNSVVVSMIIREPSRLGPILGSTFSIQILAGIATYCLLAAGSRFHYAENPQIVLLISIIGLALMLKCFEIFRYWFESQVKIKYVVWGELTVFLGMSLARIILVARESSLVAFAWLHLVEAFLFASSYVLVWHLKGYTLDSFSISKKRVLRLLNDGWPLFLSGIAAIIYMRIDQLMLRELIGNEAVGVYSAAVRLSEVWYFVPVVVSMSFFPKLLKLKEHSDKKYMFALEAQMSMLVLFAVMMAIIVFFVAPLIVEVTFGPDFRPAASVLVIHIWTSIFVFIGVASGKWYLAEGLQKLAFYRTAIGAASNVLLNFILIPAYGISGAAIATLISQVFATYLFDLLSTKTRVMFYMKTRSLLVFPILIRKYVS